MTDTDRPELSLLPGALAFDVDTLVDFFTQLTGRVPTAEEIAEVRAIFEQSVPGH